LSASNGHQLFLDKRKMNEDVENYLERLASLMTPHEFESAVSSAAGNGTVIAIDEALCADKLKTLIENSGGKAVHLTDPAILPRAVKNETEIAGSKAAHRRDGAAMVKYLAWLDRQPPSSLDEITAATRLEEFRRDTGETLQMPLRDISFDTISGFASNGAIVHYRVTTESNRSFSDNELYLVDSGGQYEDGTTDITRTIAIGVPNDEMRERFTLVLKGMIAISRLRFPPGTRGTDIDAFARRALWNAGLDYAHGTGHGVGSYLSVHEGPQRIAKTGTEPLRAGMILSNEPGYYKEGAYGIRIENLILVTEPEKIGGGDIAMHAFETLTLAPIDRRLIKAELLDNGELDWLNAYHARVRDTVLPLLDSEEDRNWLVQATSPLG
jgi:Xaa-Pro aminopeptidase